MEFVECAQKYDVPRVQEVMKKETNRNVGEILALMESTIADKEQCKATKLLVKQILWRNHNSAVKMLDNNMEEKDA